MACENVTSRFTALSALIGITFCCVAVIQVSGSGTTPMTSAASFEAIAAAKMPMEILPLIYTGSLHGGTE